MDDDVKRSVLLRILPESEERELRNQWVSYKTCETLRGRVLEIVNERTRGLAPMLFMVEDEEQIEDDEGEWLMKIENRNGHKQKRWTRVCPKGVAKARKGCLMMSATDEAVLGTSGVIAVLRNMRMEAN